MPILSFLIAPGATRCRIEQMYRWVGCHQWLAVAGVHLVIIGVSEL